MLIADEYDQGLDSENTLGRFKKLVSLGQNQNITTLMISATTNKKVIKDLELEECVNFREKLLTFEDLALGGVFQFYYKFTAEEKYEVLLRLLSLIINHQIIIFVGTKEECKA
jgi:superfamily II DNA/RNA helicase